MATAIPDNRARFSAARLQQLFGAPVAGPPVGVCGVVTDSRRVQAGQLYVALSGEHHDGHRFLPQVAGVAAAALVRPGTAVPAGLTAYAVADPLVGLGMLALHHRRRWTGRVVAITGSAGKTTTKELTAAALRATGMRVMRTAGNLNNRVGVPLTLLTLEPDVDLAVIEAGTSMPGEIGTLTAMIEPDLAVVTSVAAAHTAGLGDIEAVADEKVSIFDGLHEDGVAIYCADIEPLRARAERFGGAARLSFGTAADANLRLLAQRVDPELRSHCRFGLPDGREVAVRLGMLGIGPAVDAAAALCCVIASEGPEAVDAALPGLAALPAVPGRLRVVAGPGGSALLDDSYNANPASMRASLQTLAEAAAARGGRAIAVLGGMRELGPEGPAAHANVGAQCRALGISALVACGPEMGAAADAYRAGTEAPVQHVPDALAAIDAVPPLQPADVVLVKGSRSLAMERVVTALRQEQDA